MIGVTHTGKVSDLGFILPICSWLHETYEEKIVFIIKESVASKKLESLLRLQSFTHNVFFIHNSNINEEAYKFDPNEYIENLNIRNYYNFGFRSKPNKFITEFYAEEHGLGYNSNFVLNLELDFKYGNNKIMCTDVISPLFPNYHTIDLSKDFLVNLQEMAYAKERHVHASSIGVYLSLAGIPFYYYTVDKVNSSNEFTPFQKIDIIDAKENMTKVSKNMLALDVRSLDNFGKIISIYDQVYFQ